MQTTHKLSHRTLNVLLALFVTSLVSWQVPSLRSTALAYSQLAVRIAEAAADRVTMPVTMKYRATPDNDRSPAGQPSSTRYKVMGANSLPSTFASPFVLGVTVGANINISRRAGNESEATISVNPANPNQVVALSNIAAGNGLFKAFSTDGGTTWTTAIIANGDNLGTACCDAQSAGIFDEFGNFFLVYLNTQPTTSVRTAISTDGGMTFTPLATLTAGSADQPSIAIGAGTVWICYNVSGTIRVRGAAVTNLGTVGAFNAEQTVPGSGTGISGNFGDVAVGPSGQVMVVYQNANSGQGPDTIFANVDPDGLGAMGFGSRLTVTATNVGGFDNIPAQNGRSIDAEAGLAWDRSGGPHRGRVYLVYTDETVNENNDTDIFVRYSDDLGLTWSTRVRVNDDATLRSQFLPHIALDQTTGNIAVSWHDCRNDAGSGPGDTNGVANDDAQFFATFSTDGAATFLNNVRVSAGTSNAAASGNGIDFGDYTGLAFHAGRAFPIWADNSNSTNDNPNGALSGLDIYTARLLLVDQQADLAVTKAALAVEDPDGAGPLAPVTLPPVGPNVPAGAVKGGGYIRYDVLFGNSGPADAINVILQDVIPGNTAFVGAIATGGVFVPATQPPAVPFTFTIQATRVASPNLNLTCTVVGAAGNQQIYCRPQNNPGPPVVADGTLPAGYNGTLTFFVKVNESVSGGTVVANPAKINSGFCPTGAVPPYPPTACASTPDPNPDNNTSLPTSTVVVANSTLTISKIVQSAVTTASNPNQTGPLGPAADTTPVTGNGGVATTGTAVLPGTLMTYRVVITNIGPSDVANVRFTDFLPAGLEIPPGRVLGVRYVSVNQVSGNAVFTCSPPTGVPPSNNPQSNGGQVSCTAPLLSANAPNNTVAFNVVVFIDPATKASLVNGATVDATINNFNIPVSASAVLTTPVAPTSDLALTKTHTNAAGVVGGPITAGTVFTYTVTLTNNGPSAAQMVSLVDTLPIFQQVRSIQVLQTPDGNGAPNLTCTATPAIGLPTTTGNNTTSVTCTAAELPPNRNANGTVNPAGTVTIILTVRQDELTTQPLPVNYANCVSVTSMSIDPVAANSTNVCDPLMIGFQTAVSGTKVDVPDPVIAGNLLTYTITGTNNGPSAALDFMISDPLPVGTSFVSAVASPGATLMTPAVGTVGVSPPTAATTVKATWDAAGGTPGGLTAPGVSRTLTIVVRVCPDFQQILNLTDAQMCVPNLTDTATISTLTPGTPPGVPPVPATATASSITTVQAQSDLSISKSAAGQINYSTTGSPSNITYTITFANAGPSNANGVTITDLLPKGFTVMSTSSTVPGTTFTTTTTDGTSTVVANLGVLGAPNQCQLTRPTSGTLTIVARVPIKNPSISVTNQATIASTNCLPETGTLPLLTNLNSGLPPIITPGTLMLANNRAFASTNIVPPGTTPGQAYPALSEASDQKEGSILFYPVYTSDAVNGNTQNTRIAITNTSNTEKATVHLFAVDGASCAVLDAFICLTPNQTTAFLASDFDPGNTGYLVAVAVESATGLPRAFNELIGDEYVKFSTGHAANLGAEAIAASMIFPTGVDPNVTTTTLRFDGMNYNRLPRVIASDNIPSPADGNSTMLIIDRVGGDFTTTGANISNITGLLYDDSEQQFSFTANLGFCQYRTILSNTFPRTFTQFSRILPAGRSGWMKFWSVNDWALFGAQINFNASATTNTNAFNQGHNLHKLTLTNAATITVPVFIPSC